MAPAFVFFQIRDRYCKASVTPMYLSPGQHHGAAILNAECFKLGCLTGSKASCLTPCLLCHRQCPAPVHTLPCPGAAHLRARVQTHSGHHGSWALSSEALSGAHQSLPAFEPCNADKYQWTRMQLSSLLGTR